MNSLSTYYVPDTDLGFAVAMRLNPEGSSRKIYSLIWVTVRN